MLARRRPCRPAQRACRAVDRRRDDERHLRAEGHAAASPKSAATTRAPCAAQRRQRRHYHRFAGQRREAERGDHQDALGHEHDPLAVEPVGEVPGWQREKDHRERTHEPRKAECRGRIGSAKDFVSDGDRQHLAPDDRHKAADPIATVRRQSKCRVGVVIGRRSRGHGAGERRPARPRGASPISLARTASARAAAAGPREVWAWDGGLKVRAR